MRDVHVSSLEVFCEIARRGSVTAAAQALGYTQSAVSRQLATLESEVGAKLFDRLPRGVQLTEEGRCLLGHAEAVVERIRIARRDLAALHDLEAGRLRVGAFPTADAVLVPTALSRFRAAHPRIDVTLVEGRTPEHLTRLRADDLDIAVVSDHPGQRIDPAGVTLTHLLDDPLLVALPRSHRLAGRRTVRLGELSDESWIAGSPVITKTLLGACLRQGFEPRIDFVVAEWMAKLGMVAAGVGITLVAALAAPAVRKDVALVRLAEEDTPIRTVYLATAEGITPSPAVQAFREVLHEAAAGLDGAEGGEPRVASPARPVPAAEQTTAATGRTVGAA